MTGGYSVLFSAMAVLLLVAGIAVVAGIFMKYVTARSGGTGRTGAPVRVLNMTWLGQKRNIAVVDVAGEILVLGITSDSINLLEKVEEEERARLLRKGSMQGVGLVGDLLRRGLFRGTRR